jgi:hypothetical protein
MNNFFEQFKTQAREIRLSASEKDAMKRAIFGMPSPMPQPVKSPFVPFAFSLSVHFRAVMAGFLVFILVGTSTAYAAEGALPGEPLYAVKIAVNENVETALAVTPAQKAGVHAKLAQRRVEEAEALAAKGNLDATTTAELTANFDAHAQAAASSTVELAQADPAAAAEAKAQFDSSIQAHGEILAVLGDTSSSTQVRANTAVIARAALALADRRGHDAQDDSVRANALAAKTATMATAQSLRVRTFAATAPVSADAASSSPETPRPAAAKAPNPGAEKIAATFEARASATISDVQSKYGAMKTTLSADTIMRIDARLASTSALMSAGSAALGAGNYEEALKDFTHAYRFAAELSAYLGAQQKFNKENILPNLLKNSDDR